MLQLVALCVSFAVQSEADGVEQKLRKLRDVHAGMMREVEKVQADIRRLEQEAEGRRRGGERGEHGGDDLGELVRELRREVADLREQVRQLRGQGPGEGRPGVFGFGGFQSPRERPREPEKRERAQREGDERRPRAEERGRIERPHPEGEGQRPRTEEREREGHRPQAEEREREGRRPPPESEGRRERDEPRQIERREGSIILKLESAEGVKQVEVFIEGRDEPLRFNLAPEKKKEAPPKEPRKKEPGQPGREKKELEEFRFEFKGPADNPEELREQRRILEELQREGGRLEELRRRLRGALQEEEPQARAIWF
jgi:hypothetical protein